MSDEVARRRMLARDREQRMRGIVVPPEPIDLGEDLLLIVGGSPAARAVADALDSPEVRERLRESFEQLARQAGLLVEQVARAFGEAVAAYRSAMLDLEPLREQLVAAGMIERPLPEDPRERALELRRHRGTGPDRQVQHRHAPRRLP